MALARRHRSMSRRGAINPGKGRPDDPRAGAGARRTRRTCSSWSNAGKMTPCAAAACGVAIPARPKVLLMLAAANRDPRAVPDPGRPDLTRRPKRSRFARLRPALPLGANLARMEGQVASARLARRFP